ncbi:PilN domain-containing protein [Nitrospiraceae bacterium AH_259_D15_M11_P09]|nr:PilN domain-containing protein [Nitrospiraceae bacterium AH_259_D15_M11_P09]
MKPPRLHLALTAHGFGVLRAAQWAMAVVILGSLLSAGWLWQDSRDLEEQAIRYERAAERLHDRNRQFATYARQEGFDVSEQRNQALAREVAFANTLIEKRGFSWTRFLGDLEETVRPQVSIASVKLDFQGSTITLAGSALTLKDLTAFVNTLENHVSFQNVVLSQHQVRQDEKQGSRRTAGSKNRPSRFVEFQMKVSYRPTL